MDPEACLQRAQRAFVRGEYSEARAALRDYAAWRAAGGYEPKGDPADYVAGRPESGDVRARELRASLVGMHERKPRGVRRTVIERIGDTSPEDHGGGALVKVRSRYGCELMLEYTPGIEGAETDGDEYGTREEQRAYRKTGLEVYRVPVGATPEDIRSALDWCEWESIARYTDQDPWEIFEAALSGLPRDVCYLYELAASYHGWSALDDDPLVEPYWAVARRWTSPRRTCKRCGLLCAGGHYRPPTDPAKRAWEVCEA